jgi:dolichol-phosphate mannosyltransferase
MDNSTNFRFQRLIKRIMRPQAMMRIIKFSVVGATGVLVNAGLLYLLTEKTGVLYIKSSLVAIECAIINNFLWNYFWTWGDRASASKSHFFRSLAKFNFSSGIVAFVVNWGLLILLTEVFGIPYQYSNLMGIAVGTVVNFTASHFWSFSSQKNESR